MQSTIIIRHGLMSGTLVLSQLLIIPALLAAPASTTNNSSSLSVLSSFLKQVERKHPQLKAAKAKFDAAKARTSAASHPLYNPEIELGGERVGFNKDKVNTITLGVNQTIDWHDKRTAKKNIASIGQQVTLYEQETSHQQLIANIFSALAGYQVQQEIVTAHNKRHLLAKQILTQASRLYKAGDISKLDLEQIRLSQVQIQLTLNQAKTKLTNKSHTLSTMAGDVHKVWPSLPYAPPVLQPAKLNYDQILANLPMLKADTTRVEQARKVLRLRTREQKPDPTIGLRVGAEDSDKVIGLTLSIPLNVRNNYSAEVDEARANIRQAESTLENSRYQLHTRLQSAAQTYYLTYSSWKSWQKIASSSLQKQSHLLMRLWKAGELSTSDYLVQLNQIKEAELNNVELKGNTWKAWFNWLAVSNQFNQWLNGRIK